MKKNTLISMVAAATLLFTAGCAGGTGGSQNNAGNTPATGGETPPAAEQKQTYKIGISQIVEHPSLDATRQGFLDGLKDSGLVEGENLEVEVGIAQGDMTNNTTIAQGFKSGGVDLALGIATPSAQALAQEIEDVPVVFTAVTDPLGAGLVPALDKPGANVTGVSDTHPQEIEKLMEFISTQFPNVKTLGTVINEGEQNSVVSIERAEAALKSSGVTVVKAAVTNSSEVLQAAESLVGRADAIYIPKDNTVISAFEAVIQVANENDLPLFAGDIDSVGRGAFATFGYQYYDIGYTTGKMAADILLNGKNPGEIPVGFPEQLDLYISEKAAAEQGIEITQTIRDMIVDPEKHIVK